MGSRNLCLMSIHSNIQVGCVNGSLLPSPWPSPSRYALWRTNNSPWRNHSSVHWFVEIPSKNNLQLSLSPTRWLQRRCGRIVEFGKEILLRSKTFIHMEFFSSGLPHLVVTSDGVSFTYSSHLIKGDAFTLVQTMRDADWFWSFKVTDTHWVVAPTNWHHKTRSNRNLLICGSKMGFTTE